MNQNTLNKIVKNRAKFVPHIFTNRQIEIVEKYVNNLKLTKTEQSYLYSTIKRKIDALSLLKEEFHINGSMKYPDRIEKAKEIITQINKKTFISGSFLYSENYNDIDLYIISNKRKSYHKENIHYIFITEQDLKKPLFYSVYKFSISNFFINNQSVIIKRPIMNDIIMAYEMAINEILDNDDQKMIRDVVFEYYKFVKNVILDSCSLYEKFNEIKSRKKTEKIEIINELTKELLLKLYAKNYTYNELGAFIKRLKKTEKEYPQANENIKIYSKLLSEVKDECRRAKV